MKRYSCIRSIIAVILTGLVTTVVNAQHFTEFEFYGETAPVNIRQAMQNNAKAVFKEIHEAYYAQRQGLALSGNNATQEAIERIQALWSTSKFYCVEPELILPVLKLAREGEGYQVRNVSVFFTDGATDEDKYQEIVLEFATDGKISDIYIALQNHQVQKIFEKASGVTDLRRRQLILGFVENFRTAYNRKDITYLNQVFSDDALIITGKVLASKGDSPNPTVEYVTQSKSQYIEKLKQVFARNSFINIKFDEINVTRDDEPRDYIYGVKLRQRWNSSNYSDEGWLFLMIDFRDENNPQIWVRTWQPLEVPKNKVYGVVDFDIQ